MKSLILIVALLMMMLLGSSGNYKLTSSWKADNVSLKMTIKDMASAGVLSSGSGNKTQLAF